MDCVGCNHDIVIDELSFVGIIRGVFPRLLLRQGTQIRDVLFQKTFRVLLAPEVELEERDACFVRRLRDRFFPKIVRKDIVISCRNQSSDECRTNESAVPGNKYFGVFIHKKIGKAE